MAEENSSNYFERNFHTDKYKLRTTVRTMSNPIIHSFIHLNSFWEKASRGGEIK